MLQCKHHEASKFGHSVTEDQATECSWLELFRNKEVLLRMADSGIIT